MAQFPTGRGRGIGNSTYNIPIVSVYIASTLRLHLVVPHSIGSRYKVRLDILRPLSLTVRGFMRSVGFCVLILVLSALSRSVSCLRRLTANQGIGIL